MNLWGQMHPILQSRTRNANNSMALMASTFIAWQVALLCLVYHCYNAKLGAWKWHMARKSFSIRHIYCIYMFSTHSMHIFDIELHFYSNEYVSLVLSHQSCLCNQNAVWFCPQLVVAEYMSTWGSWGQGWFGQDNVRFGGEMLQRWRMGSRD